MLQNINTLLYEKIRKTFEQDEVIFEVNNNQTMLVVKHVNALKLLKFLYDNPELEFKVLSDMLAVDYVCKGVGLGIIYNLLSIKYNYRIFIKTLLGDDETMVSVIPMFKNAIFFEREIYDMYGITFKGHKHLTRILNNENYSCYPLRKTSQSKLENGKEVINTESDRKRHDIFRKIKECIFGT